MILDMAVYVGEVNLQHTFRFTFNDESNDESMLQNITPVFI
jgi:hypothetical protein